MRFASIVVSLAFFAAPLAAQPIVQPQVGLPAALEVQRLAPQLVEFAGSRANFNSLVSGLSFGRPITLETIGADGTRQLVTFTPSTGPMSPVEIARTLETARQQLIASGIATPNAQQLSVALTGREVPVTTQPPAPAATAAQPVSPARELQSRSAVGSTAASPSGQPVVPRGNTSDSPIIGNTSDTPRLAPNPTAPTGPASQQGGLTRQIAPGPGQAPASPGAAQSRGRLGLGR